MGGLLSVGPDDPRYEDLRRGENPRFAGRPERIVLVSSAAEIEQVLNEAVRDGSRVAVRSGGHCLEDFVSDPEVRVVLDMTRMSGVGFDEERRAFVVESGATLGTVYRTLYRLWGVTIPGGTCPEVGAGGHILGGGYGPLSRLHGSVVDYLYAAEVVVVDANGTARTVVATREPDDPHHDLWWAHTGGGGGNFGVVVRYWLKSPDTEGELRQGEAAAPERLLPRPPSEVLLDTTVWPWDGLSREDFVRLVRNHGAWFERHSGPDSPWCGLYSVLALTRRQSGALAMTTQLDAGLPQAADMLRSYVDAVSDGLPVRPHSRTLRMPWLHGTRWPGTAGDGDPTARTKIKVAYARRRLTDRRIGTVHDHLTDPAHDIGGGVVALISYGGRVNAVPPGRTAVPQRDSILKVVYGSTWQDAAQDAEQLGWVRELYRDVYADTGGVPVPDEDSDGAYINYPDVDLADPAWNTSGVQWPELYYGEALARLRRIKAEWDPGNVFRHALSIPAAGA
ncbi:FAD-binding oxidoreductase [Streptomyces sp. NA04227]|uniref:FAD-binding oxidoreductase n=1 Tax=Streptomyces sp. NA04227 TaxID=2742136 RepID=UPI001C375F88|nr:FAD-binding protein [Streptomyces sp. NA04227]